MDLQIPVDEQAEFSVLGRMMSSTSTANNAFATLTDADFFYPKNSAIFSAMHALMKVNAVVEPLSVSRVLKEMFPQQADEGLIFGLQRQMSAYTDDATHFIDSVKNCAIYRRLILLCKETMSKACSKKFEPSELQTEMTNTMDTIFHGKSESSFHNLFESYSKSYRDSGLDYLAYIQKKRQDRLDKSL